MLNSNVITFDNGFRAVLDYVPHVKSATLGLWANVGSKIESLDNNGICHFLEHMVFKGTTTRSALQIADFIETKGGYVNAWTSKEKTAWYIKVQSAYINSSIEILFDILQNSVFPADELQREKGVILEEIKMYLDDNHSLVETLYDKLAYKDHALGLPIIGNPENINKFSSQDFVNHLQEHYHPQNMIFVISGNFDEVAVMKLLEKYNNNWQANNVVSNKQPSQQPKVHFAKDLIIKENAEQTNIIYGLNAVGYSHDDYYKYTVANTILGSGMSSRLFLEVREKRGLAYAIHSFMDAYFDVGTLAVSVGCSQNNASVTLEVIQNQLAKVVNDVTLEELTKAKNILQSSILMSLESTYARADRIANNVLNFGYVKSSDYTVEQINAVNIDDVKMVYHNLLASSSILAVLSNSHITL